MDFRIGLDLPAPIPPGAPLEQIFPRLSAVVSVMSREAQTRWLGYARGEPLPSGRSIRIKNNPYASSIGLTQVQAFAWRVESALPVADTIERGAPAYDMKRALQTSAKTRVNQQGGRYLIIPFRHGTPGAVTFKSVMPDHVHELARQLSASRVTGSHQAPNQIGVHDLRTRQLATVERRSYAWGGRLPAGMVAKRHERHKTDPFAGMVRFDNPDGRHSNFLTFRTMSEKSSGWNRPALPGYWPARTVAEQLQPRMESLAQQAVEADMSAYLAGGS